MKLHNAIKKLEKAGYEIGKHLNATAARKEGAPMICFYVNSYDDSITCLNTVHPNTYTQGGESYIYWDSISQILSSRN